MVSVEGHLTHCTLLTFHPFSQLTAQEQAAYRSGAYRLLPKRDRKGRSLGLIRLYLLDVGGKMQSFARYLWYVRSGVLDDPDMQRNGVVWVLLDGEDWVSSAFQIASVLKMCHLDAMPIRDICRHCVVNSASKEMAVQNIRCLMPTKELRMRVRTHVGSSMEVDYALRTFGIDVSSILFGHSKKPTNDDDDDESLEADIRERQRLDDEWRESEAPYPEPTSLIALFPNPQDIIMGRNKVVAKTWTGNVTFRKLIDDNVHRYVEAQRTGAARPSKTLIAVEILYILQKEHHARFLTREETRWIAVDDAEARKKITQAMRGLARERGTPC